MPEFKKTQTLFLYPCDCGLEFRLPIGKAGQTVNCPNCGSDQLVCGLKELRQLKSIEKRLPSKLRFQFGIRSILVVTVFVAIVLGLLNRIGLEATLFFVGLPVFYCIAVFVVTFAEHNFGVFVHWCWDRIERK